MSKPIIKVENLSKSYIINHEGQERYTAMRDVIARKAKKIFSFPSFLSTTKRINNSTNQHFNNSTNQQFNNSTNQHFNNSTNQQFNNSTTEEFWALKDINFEINQGDRVGIIGRNGAGKSTLLKVLSRITEPTKGRITLNGRVASLLEVGTGFHPELTGRENIYLNGAILGMSRAEIKSKFDEIVDFAEVEQFLDTPVKRYSSGMYVRLAFAVAAHLEPEILIVDEVLAVGDAQFQKKCLGKMEDVSKNEGRTVLFVSHNMAAVKSFCNRLILLSNGSKTFDGNVNTGISNYLSDTNQGPKNGVIEKHHRTINNGKVFYRSINILNSEYTNGNVIYFNNPIELRCEIEFLHYYSDIIFDVRVISNDGIELAHTMNTYYQSFYTVKSDFVNYNLKLENTFQPGNYYLTFGIHLSDGSTLDYIEKCVEINILNITKDDSIGMIYDFKLGFIRPNAVWEII